VDSREQTWTPVRWTLAGAVRPVADACRVELLQTYVVDNELDLLVAEQLAASASCESERRFYDGVAAQSRALAEDRAIPYVETAGDRREQLPPQLRVVLASMTLDAIDRGPAPPAGARLDCQLAELERASAYAELAGWREAELELGEAVVWRALEFLRIRHGAARRLRSDDPCEMPRAVYERRRRAHVDAENELAEPAAYAVPDRARRRPRPRPRCSRARRSPRATRAGPGDDDGPAPGRRRRAPGPRGRGGRQ
jgi:hypothetical protein